MKELFGCGFNAANQVSAFTGDIRDEPQDVMTLTRLMGGDVTVVWIGRFEVVVHDGTHFHLLGWSARESPTRKLTLKVDSNRFFADPSSPDYLCHFFGTYQGVYGAISRRGCVYKLESRDDLTHLAWTAVAMADENDSPKLTHIAITGAERVSIVLQTAPMGNQSTTHIMEFADLPLFLSWYADPSGEQHEEARSHGLLKHFMTPGAPRQLVANQTCFSLLNDAGHVYTWGDARYQVCLGRSPSGKQEAAEPIVVDALGGIRVVKVVSGGWVTAVVSEEQDAYIWGAKAPRRHDDEEEKSNGGVENEMMAAIDASLFEADEDVHVVNLPANEQGEISDVLDMAVGNGHVAVMTTDDRLFVCGEGRNGQLGLLAEETGEARRFVREWTEVVTLREGDSMKGLPRGKRSIFCGEKHTFLFSSFTEEDAG